MANVDISPARAMQYVARYAPQTTSIVYESGDLTAPQVVDLSSRLAALLRDGGVEAGDRVAYLGHNSPILVLLHLACAHLKAAFVPLNFRLARPEYEYILEQSATHTVVVEPTFVPMMEQAMPTLDVRRWLVVDDDAACPLPEDLHLGPRWLKLSEQLAATPHGAAPVSLGFDDLGALLYTSGTTGRAKGVMLTHGNLWWNHVNVDSVVQTTRTDVTLAAAPLFHIGGLNAVALRAMLRGGTMVIRRMFVPGEALADLEKYKVTTLFGVPAMFGAMAHLPEFAATDLSSVRSAIVAGSPVPPPLIARYAQEKGMFLQQAWGLTETSPFATYLPWEQTTTRTGSAGVPMPYTEVKVVDTVDGHEITEPGIDGELCVRGPNVTNGYWRNPEATQAAFDADGWFHSGDIGRLDAEGYVYIVDRLKDMIISGGENVYPAEVEHAIVDFPGVVEVAVIGAPDPKWGETIVAVLQCKEGVTPTLEEIRDHASRSLARYKLPTRVEIVNEIPKNGTGKINKIALREELLPA